MKRKLIIMCVFVWALSVLATGAGLRVDKTYPRWLNFKGERAYVISSGLGQVPSGPLLDELCAAGVNGYREHIFLNSSRKKNCPYRCGTGANVNNNWNGWNEPFFSRLKEKAKTLQKRNAFLFVVVGSAPMRRVSTGGWSTHLWNIRNGGPLPKGSHGVRDFYRLAKPGTYIHDLRYSRSWKWESKNQYRQEQLLVKLNSELNEKQYPNVAIVLIWEIFTGFDEAWTNHMTGLIHRVTQYRPVGIGTYKSYHLDRLNKKSLRPIFGVFEGADYRWLVDRGGPYSGKYPLIGMGFHCQEAGFWYPQNLERRCQCFVAGAEKENIAGGIDNMAYAFMKGINTSLPFPFYWHRVDTYVSKVCAGKYPIETYKPHIVKSELLRFLSLFRGYVDRLSLKGRPSWLSRIKLNRWLKKHKF